MLDLNRVLKRIIRRAARVWFRLSAIIPSTTPLKALELIEEERKERTGKLFLIQLGLKKIPQELADMDWLVELNLMGNYLVRIEGLETLVNLRRLHLPFNLLTRIEGLDNLVDLKELSLDYNLLARVGGLGTLANLQRLSLSNNRLTDIEGLETLVNLQFLDLGDNPIQNLSSLLPILKRDPALRLIVRHCPITIPPIEIALKSNQAILDYFDSLETEGEVLNDQIKLIFLGNSSCGKTSLSKFLFTEEFDSEEPSTHGIRNTTWLIPASGKDPAFTVNVLDFGGQEYYHATHRMFLTSDAIYVVVCTRANDRNGSLPIQINVAKKEKVNGEWVTETFGREVVMRLFPYSYWLQTISFYTGSKEGNSRIQTVHMVENKSALRKEERPLRLDPQFENNFPFQFRGFYELDTAEAYGYNKKGQSVFGKRYHLKHEVWKDDLIADLRTQIVSSTIPGNYPVIRDLLKDLAESMRDETMPDKLAELLKESGIESPGRVHFMLPWISYEDYKRIIRRYTNSPNPDFGNLHTYLQDHCGRILYFPDKSSLKENVCIDPNWLHERIYDVLNEDIREKSGLFNLEHVDSQVEGRKLEAGQMVDIMKKFYLVFEVKGEGGYIAPQYLPEECPPEKKESLERSVGKEKFRHELSIVYDDFLPPAVLSQYIALKGTSALEDIYWKYGLMYEEMVQGEPVNTFIRCIEEGNAGEIQILLPENEPEGRRSKVIRRFVAAFADELHQARNISLRKPGYEAASYDRLCRAKEHRYDSVVVTDSRSDIVKARVYFPYLPDYRKKEISIFISYSHAPELMDAFEVFQNKFRDYMKLDGILIRITSDLDIENGTRWMDFLTREIAECNLFVALLSQPFLNSNFIKKHELGATLTRYNDGQEVALCLVRFAPFNPKTNIDIRALQTFKPDGREFGKPDIGNMFAFTDAYNDPNLVNRYMERLARDLTPVIEKLWKDKTGLEPGRRH